MGQDAEKRAAAGRALADLQDGMALGLGSGSTAEIFVRLLGARVGQGLKVTGLPTSERTRVLALQCGIPLTDFDHTASLDLAIDGADQVERGSLALVKGLGGALMREKIVAASAKRFVVIVDTSKLVDRLGGRTLLPVEIASFGAPATLERLAAKGWRPTLRRAGAGPFVTDGGNLIADCAIETIADPRALEADLRAVPGVIETGLFVGMTSRVYAAGPNGVEELGP